MSDPDQPWGAPQVPPYDPAYDPRSPQWRDPSAQAWWDHRNGPPPVPTYSPPPPRSPRHPKIYVALGLAVVLLLALGVTLAATRGSSKQDPSISSTFPVPVESTLPKPGIIPPLPSTAPQDSAAPTEDADPVRVTQAYYTDLADEQPTKAFGLLCAARQQAMPLAAYTEVYAQDVSTGTGIKTFTPSGNEQEQGDQAAVPGTLVLSDKESVPITVLLVKESGSWRVCSSDLGGVLPNPGSGTDPGSGGVTT